MIVIITYENYNESSPGAIRNKSFVNILDKMGYMLIVFHKGVYSSDRRIVVKSLYHRNKYFKILLFARKVIKYLNDLNTEGTLDGVIMYSAGALHNEIAIRNWCIKHNIPIIFDVVEWYSKEQFKYGSLDIRYISKQLENAWLINQSCRIISISNYLYEYFKRKGIKTVRIPIIADRNNLVEVSSLKAYSLRTIIYAGSHFKMDNVLLVIKSLSLIPIEKQKCIRFQVYGFSEDRVRKEVGLDLWSRTKHMVFAYGRRPNTEILKAYAESDFTILFRDPSCRVNQAGFPSKVIESMSKGVPILCNYSSDLNEFLVNGINSIITKDLSVAAIVESLERIINMTDEEVIGMKTNAINTINEKFMDTSFMDKFNEILERV